MKKQKTETIGNILLLPIKQIESNPMHPRIYYDENEMQNLTVSITQMGILRPITVICDDNERYYIVHGERRYRAAKNAGMAYLPCMILDIPKEKAAFSALSENMQQCDLNYFEIAEYLERLHQVYGYTYMEIAEELCIGFSDINYYLRYLKIDEAMRDKMIAYGVTKRHAMIMLKLPQEKRETLLDEIIEKKLNVNMTMARCKELIEPQREKNGKITAYFKNTDIFINTVNKAVKTMKESGISAEYTQEETENAMDYYIHIPKIG